MEINEVDKLVRSRIKVIIFGAFSFALWQFSWIAMDLMKGNQSNFLYVVSAMVITGALCWVFTSYLFYAYSKKVKQINACQALNDELTLKNRAHAFMSGYFILFGMIWLLIPATDFWEFDLKIAIRAIAVLAIVIPMLIFAYSELRNDEGAE